MDGVLGCGHNRNSCYIYFVSVVNFCLMFCNGRHLTSSFMRMSLITTKKQLKLNRTIKNILICRFIGYIAFVHISASLKIKMNCFKNRRNCHECECDFHTKNVISTDLFQRTLLFCFFTKFKG